MDVSRLIDIKMSRLRDDTIVIMDSKVKQKNTETMQEAIRKKVYGRPASSSYQRSYEMISAVESRLNVQGNVFTLRTFVAPYKLTHVPKTRHSSWIDGADKRGAIPLWLDQGNGTGGIVSYSGTFYREEMVRLMIQRKEALNILKKELKNRGYIVK